MNPAQMKKKKNWWRNVKKNVC